MSKQHKGGWRNPARDQKFIITHKPRDVPEGKRIGDMSFGEGRRQSDRKIDELRMERELREVWL